MTKLIYIVVHTCGQYSDYTENTIGVFDSKEFALGAAKQAADEWNHSNVGEGWWGVDHDCIVLRRFPLNETLLGTSEAQRVAEAKSDNYGKTIYQLTDNFELDSPVLVEVTDDEQ